MRARCTALVALFTLPIAFACTRAAEAQTPVPELPAPSPTTAPAASTAATATPTSTPIANGPPTQNPTPPQSPNDNPFFRLALQTESAIGVTPGPFYNHFLGARFDRCFTWYTCLGAYAGYANLKGQSGRANNVLLYVLLEHRRPLGRLLFLPLRTAIGYLPRNGAFGRFSAGLGARLGNVDVTLDLIAPTVWVTGNEQVLSMDLSAEVAFRF